MKCSSCKTDWPEFSEQSKAVELYGHCMGCECKYTFFSSLPWDHNKWGSIISAAQKSRAEHLAKGFHGYLDTIQPTREA